jgi:hypothetical protein
MKNGPNSKTDRIPERTTSPDQIPERTKIHHGLRRCPSCDGYFPVTWATKNDLYCSQACETGIEPEPELCDECGVPMSLHGRKRTGFFFHDRGVDRPISIFECPEPIPVGDDEWRDE